MSTSVQLGPPVWSQDPFQDHTLFRGPKWEGIPIDTSLLEGSPGMLIGHSQSDIRSGIWTQMGVHYRFQRDVAIFGSQQWQYDAMGLRGPDSRRSLRLLNWE